MSVPTFSNNIIRYVLTTPAIDIYRFFAVAIKNMISYFILIIFIKNKDNKNVGNEIGYFTK